MPGTTEHYGLTTLQPGESLAVQGARFIGGDRTVIDRLGWLGAEGHRHDGRTRAADPDTAPALVLDSTAGAIAAGKRVTYRYTIVDVNGLESAASPEVHVDTPPPVATPGTPTLSLVSATGHPGLAPGTYSYRLSAYTGTPDQETAVGGVATIQVPSTGGPWAVQIYGPTLPTGADGFNIYRRRPGSASYYFVGNTFFGAATDNGDGLTEDMGRRPPTRNTTHRSNRVTVTFPTIPADHTWRLYRTYNSASWDSSLLAEGSAATYVDAGAGTQLGRTFPLASQLSGSPTKIDVRSEIRGIMPMGRVDYPQEVVFSFPGVLAVTAGTFVWINEFPAITIIGIRATLGLGSTPAATPVIVDVNLVSFDGTGALYYGPTTLFTTQANRPTIAVGKTTHASRKVPDVVNITRDQGLTVDIDQAGGGAGTDQDLMVTVFFYAWNFDVAQWDPPGGVDRSGLY